MFDWNDLRYFLAVAHYNSTLAAGRALGLSQSTVQRRLAELERQIGQPLVPGRPVGYKPPDLGPAMPPHAERLEAEVHFFAVRVGVARRACVGVLRVACPKPILYQSEQPTSELLSHA